MFIHSILLSLSRWKDTRSTNLKDDAAIMRALDITLDRMWREGITDQTKISKAIREILDGKQEARCGDK
jgi:hypothetical protein